VEYIAAAAELLIKAWKSRKATSQLVRYEELVRRPAETIEGVLDYLDVDGSPEIIEAMVCGALEHPEADGHRTTRTAVESIGRRRRDLPRRLCSAVRESLHEPLAELGYDLS
jgi:hypothetical protein